MMSLESLIPDAPYCVGKAAKVAKRELRQQVRENQQRGKRYAEIAKAHLAP